MKSKPIPNFSNYVINEAGIIVGPGGRNQSAKTLIFHYNHRGYARVSLHQKGKTTNKMVHRLVLETFIGPCPQGMQCAHLDGNPKNNCLSNLKWTSPKENNSHQLAHGTRVRGAKHGRSKLSESDIKNIRLKFKKLNKTSSNRGQLSKEFGVSKTMISRIIYKKSWSHI